MDQSLKDFVAEAEDILENLDVSIGALVDMGPEDHRKPDRINAVFRHVHSLKGLSGMFGLERLSVISHALENLLDALRLGRVDLTQDTIDLLGQGAQVLSRMVRAIGKGRDDASVEHDRFLESLESMIRSDQAPMDEDLAFSLEVPPGMTGMLSEYEEHRFRDNIRRGVPFFKARCRFPLESFDVELERVCSAIKEVGELLTTLPEADQAEGSQIGFNLFFTTKIDEDTLRRKIPLPDNHLETVPFVRKKDPAPRAPAVPTAPVEGMELQTLEEDVKGVSQTVRVDIGKLDSLMNLVGELVLLKNGFARAASGLRENRVRLPGDLLNDLERNSAALEKTLTQLRDGVMDVRMVPMGQLYSRLQRVAKRIARDLGKKVDLVFSGHETELDKMIMEEMVPPLLHILRNALDHGIEPPQDRLSGGKREAGTVHVSALQRGHHVIFEIEDDGCGIDLDLVRDFAVRMGELGEDERISDEEALNLLFRPGFSTTGNVTELSGRGVGMDVVKRELDRIGGAVEIRTVRGRGTRITLTLPITLAIMQALLIRSGTRTFAIPLSSVHETLELREDQIKTIRGREVMNFRDITLPVIRLEEIFGLQDPEAGNGHYVVVVGVANRRMGLVTSDLLGKQDIVIKPLGKAFPGNIGLAGAAEMDDTSTVLVLDVAGLMTEVSMLSGATGGV